MSSASTEKPVDDGGTLANSQEASVLSPPTRTEAEETGSATEDAPVLPRNIHGVRWILVIISILSTIFLYSLGNTVVANITPAVVNQFGDTVKLPWLSVGFLLGASAAVLPFGKLYGIFDAKWLYIISLAIFSVGSAVCGAGPNMNAFIVGRVVAGVGGNGMYLGVMNLISTLTTNEERPGYLSFVGLVWGIGTVLGPVVGGALVESKATWRWAFYLNLCVAGLFTPVCLFLIPSSKPQPEKSSMSSLKQFDFVGTILSAGAMTSLVMAINLGGSLYAWDSPQVIALFVVMGVLFIIFGLQQSLTIFTTTKNRIFPGQFLRNVDAILLFLCMACVSFAAFIPIYYVPLYFQFSRGDDAIKAGVRLLPLIFLLCAIILANGHLMGRLRYFQSWYIFGSTAALIGGVLMSRITTDTSTASIYGYEVLLGVGAGCFIQASYAVVQTVVAVQDRASAIGYIMLAQLGGNAIGLAIAGAVFINKSLSGLSGLLPDIPRSTLQLAITGKSSAYFRSLSPKAREKSTEIIVDALAKTFIPIYVTAALALVVSCCFTRRKL